MGIFGGKEKQKKGTSIFEDAKKETQPTKKDYFLVYSLYAKGEFRATGNASATLDELSNFDKIEELEGMILQDTLNNASLSDVDCVKITFVSQFPL